MPVQMNASEVELDVSDTQAILTVPGLYKLQAILLLLWKVSLNSYLDCAEGVNC